MPRGGARGRLPTAPGTPPTTCPGPVAPQLTEPDEGVEATEGGRQEVVPLKAALKAARAETAAGGARAVLPQGNTGSHGGGGCEATTRADRCKGETVAPVGGCLDRGVDRGLDRGLDRGVDRGLDRWG